MFLHWFIALMMRSCAALPTRHVNFTSSCMMRSNHFKSIALTCLFASSAAR
jgi:hypothetical protein